MWFPNFKLEYSVEAAIDRNFMLDASKIRVEIIGSKVIFHGIWSGDNYLLIKESTTGDYQ